MKNRIKGFIRESIHLEWKDAAKSVIILTLAFLICSILKRVDNGDVYVSMIFILAVFLISRYTKGYLYGFIASFVAVLGVNYVFTYPYFEFNFTLEGYPLTIISMLLVSIITSTLTTQVKWQEKIKLENEREKMRANLLRAVSHDLRTPLTSILGAASTVLENQNEISTEKLHELLKGIQEDSQWLIRMVENLLTVTRIDDNRSKIVKIEEAAEEVISEAVRKFRKNFSSPSVEVSIPDEPLFIEMDPILIEQVLLNLMENSAIHGKEASWIRVALTKSTHNAEFVVSDNGIGIEHARLQHFQHKDNITEEKGGFGIGLSVCETIIAAHNGEMIIKERKGGGTQVEFTIPIGENE